MAVSTNVTGNPGRAIASLARDERGSMADYALVTALFALLMLAALHGVSTGAGGNLHRTSTNLTNMAVHS